MKFVIVTGMSGAGKSTAVNILEDSGYYVIDNIPPVLIPDFANICDQGGFEKVAIGADIRGFVTQKSDAPEKELVENIKLLKHRYEDVKVVFVDADDDVLVRRYKETRRTHPMNAMFKIGVADAVKMEREMLAGIREISDIYYNTSGMSTNYFKQTFRETFSSDPESSLTVNIISFGFKYGIVTDADLVFDVRFLPNPFYIPELKPLSGLDKEVRDYVMSFEDSVEYEKRIHSLTDFVIPRCIKEGRPGLTIAIGCTGGQHRSVTFAERLNDHLTAKGINTLVIHREMRNRLS